MDRLTPDPRTVSPEQMQTLAALVGMAQPNNGQLQQLGAPPPGPMPSMKGPSALTLFLEKLLAKEPPGVVERPMHVGIRG
jgi:hypothetical protein